MKLQLSSFVALLALTATLAIAQERPAAEREVPEQPAAERDAQERPAVRRTEEAQPQGQATRQRGQQRVGADQQGDQAQMQSLDGFIAACLVIANQEEIELNRLAMDKIQNEQAKQFAQQMIQQHTQIVEQLQQLVPQDVTTELQFTSAPAGDEAANGQRPRTERRPGQQRDPNERREQPLDPQSDDQQLDQQRQQQQQQQQQTTRRPGAAREAQGGTHFTAAMTRGAPMHRLLMIDRAKAENCLAIAKQQLEKASPEEVDQVYLGQQAAAHAGMLAKLRALEGQTGAELQQVVAQAEKGTQQHLQMAEQLMKQIGSSQREGARPQNDQ